MKFTIAKLAALAALLAIPAVLQAQQAPAVTAKVYGYTKLDVIYDTQHTNAGDLAFYLLPTLAGQNPDELNITARETRIGLDLAGPSDVAYKTTGRFEIDFYSPAFGAGNENNAGPRIRLAYVDVAFANGFAVRAGQDWDAFVVVTPKTLDAAYLGDAGNLYGRRPQLRLTQDIKLGAAKLSVRAAVARTIGQQINAGDVQDGGAASAKPTLQGAVTLDASLWTRNTARISISGHNGSETLANGADVRNYDSHSLIAGLVLPLTESVAVQGAYWEGANLRSYFGGIGQGVNTTLNTAIGAQGGWAQIVAGVTPSVSVNVGYGADNAVNSDLNAGDRALNTRAFGAVTYQANAALALAFEYSGLSTEYKSAPTVNGSRYQASAIYKF